MMINYELIYNNENQKKTENFSIFNLIKTVCVYVVVSSAIQ